MVVLLKGVKTGRSNVGLDREEKRTGGERRSC